MIDDARILSNRGDIRVVAAIALCWVGALSAQPASFAGKIVRDVHYVPDQQPLARADLESVQLVRVGAPLQAADVGESIDRMFATGRYADIQVDAEPQGDGVAVRFITRAARFVGDVVTVGKTSSPPNRDQVISATQLQLGTPFQPEVLKSAEQSIQQLFTSNGLYDATVRLETVDDPEHQQTNIHIIVNPGERARYETPVIRGDTKLPDATIIRATGWRIRFIGRWRKVTATLTSKGVDNIRKKYQKQDRLAATADLISLDFDPQTRRATPTVEVNAGPKIQVKAMGAKVSKGVLKRYVPVYQEGAVDPDLLVEGARNLRDYFQSKGYPDVDVTFQDPPGSDEQTVEYFITRGPRRKLAKLEIQGNEYFDRDTLRERMILQPSSLRFRWGRYSDAFRKRDEENIAALYKSNGFRDVRVTSLVQNDYQGKPGQAAAIFSINEGPQWTVAHFEVTGAENLKDYFRANLSSAEGQPYSDTSIGADRAAIMTLYAANGYRHARFQWTATPAGPPHQVNLIYSIREGRREVVRDVLISGLRSTRLSHVERNLNITAGDPLSLPKIGQSERRLYDLDIFSKIDTAVQNSDGDETAKYVLFDFEEAHRYNLKLGVGAEIARIGGTTTTLDSPAGSTGFSPRLSVDLNRLNVLGLGHTISLQTTVSTLEQKVALSYIDPKLLNAPGRTLTFTTLYDLSNNVRTFSSRREEASVQLTQKLTRATTGFLRFAYRRVSVANVVIPDLLVPQLLQPVRIGILSANLVQDRRDNPADAHAGMYNTLDLGFASNIFGSERSFAKILARNATYHRIGKNFVLARQLTFGAILPLSIPSGFTSSDVIPLPERFFGGGNISLRAFPENQAGPRDIGEPAGPGGVATQPTGFPLGGNALLISNTELRFPLFGENIGGVLFHDAGNIYSTVQDISFRFHQRNLQDFNYMVHAVGFGIRYKTPIGPIRADLAYSINPPKFVGFNGSLQDLLQCNPSLPQSSLPPVCQPVQQSISHIQFFFSIGQTF